MRPELIAVEIDVTWGKHTLAQTQALAAVLTAVTFVGLVRYMAALARMSPDEIRQFFGDDE